jgi:hypothetical protein
MNSLTAPFTVDAVGIVAPAVPTVSNELAAAV